MQSVIEGRSVEVSQKPVKQRRASSWRRNAWIPLYHGAWGMIALPPLLAIALTGWQAKHLLLLGAWWFGYFTFYAGTQFLKSRFKPRFLPATLTYGILSGIFLTLTLIQAPHLLFWGFLYTPLIAYASYTAYMRQERSLGSGIDTVLAASLMLPVTWTFAMPARSLFGFLPFPASIPPSLWLMTGLVAMQFIGTIFYVKTNIRERGSRLFYVLSLAWHGLALSSVIFIVIISALDAPGTGRFDLLGTIHPWAHIAIWFVLFLRAVSVPVLARTRRISAGKIGAGEILLLLLFAATLIA